MAFDNKTRVKALKLLAKGMTDAEVSAKLNISTHTLRNWKRLLFTTGSIEKKKSPKKPGKPYKYSPEKITELLEKNQYVWNRIIMNGEEENEKEKH